MTKDDCENLLTNSDPAIRNRAKEILHALNAPKHEPKIFDLKFIDGETSSVLFQNSLINLFKDVKEGEVDEAEDLKRRLYTADSYEEFHQVILDISDINTSPFRLENYEGIMTMSDDKSKNLANGSAKVKGDLFEPFAYFLLHTFGAHYHIQVHTLRMASYNQEGFDMFAENFEGTTVLIQVKFHGNLFTPYGEFKPNERNPLETFYTSGWTFNRDNPTLKPFAPSGSSVSGILFTSARDVSTSIKRVAGYEDSTDFKSATCPLAVVCLKDIETLTNSKQSFWEHNGAFWEDLIED